MSSLSAFARCNNDLKEFIITLIFGMLNIDTASFVDQVRMSKIIDKLIPIPFIGFYCF